MTISVIPTMADPQSKPPNRGSRHGLLSISTAGDRRCIQAVPTITPVPTNLKAENSRLRTRELVDRRMSSGNRAPRRAAAKTMKIEATRRPAWPAPCALSSHAGRWEEEFCSPKASRCRTTFGSMVFRLGGVSEGVDGLLAIGPSAWNVVRGFVRGVLTPVGRQLPSQRPCGVCQDQAAGAHGPRLQIRKDVS